jgi:hypothetical protein
MKAKEILHTKEVKGDEIVEIKILQVPISADKTFGIKYSIVYVKGGKRLLGYDNAERKGNHRHYREKEEPYHFTKIANLIKDFKRDIKKIRGRNWDED